MIGSRSLLLILLIGSRRVLGQEILISEFLALNDGGIADEDGERSDWVEIQNRSASTLSLDGWYLTDVAIEPFKWRLPAVQLSPGESLLVFASGKDRAEAGSELHANFRLSGDGEYLALTRPDGTIAQDFAPAFSPQRADISYGIAQTVNTVILVSRPSTARIQIPASGDDGIIRSRVNPNEASRGVGIHATELSDATRTRRQPQGTVTVFVDVFGTPSKIVAADQMRFQVTRASWDRVVVLGFCPLTS